MVLIGVRACVSLWWIAAAVRELWGDQRQGHLRLTRRGRRPAHRPRHRQPCPEGTVSCHRMPPLLCGFGFLYVFFFCVCLVMFLWLMGREVLVCAVDEIDRLVIVLFPGFVGTSRV